MRKTYTIYVQPGPCRGWLPVLDLSNIPLSEARGAMTMAGLYYGTDRDFRVVCDQTGDVTMKLDRRSGPKI